jgi:hypothetical protein
MFEPFLTCKVFGVARSPDGLPLDLARRWSRNSSLHVEADGSVQWDSETALQIESETWFDAPPPVRFSTHNALIPVGHVADVSSFAFVSPIAAAPVSFRNAAPRYLHRHYPDSEVVDLTLRLDEIARDGRFAIRAIEGIDFGGLHVVWRADRAAFSKGMQKIPDLKEIQTIEMGVLDQSAQLDRNYNISLTDVGEEYTEISRCLKWLFDVLHSFTQVPDKKLARTR